ncbi:MAG: YezD family protein [Anaerocolumna aminovalerica]|uniref:YezD family protein n=1 Tax=Anaerocolumna aminovalerica TaxID=1527 RepID=UPI00280BBFCE|nr:YezD family protein [Anaerocolumna aminovalerica]MDU6265132.1 YezD family protein [Anaerocolumna aminovalerica]
MEVKKDISMKRNSVSGKDLQTIIEFIESIQFGSITIIVQDGRIVQIEKNEKVRMK